MKHFVPLFLLLFLISCSSSPATESTAENTIQANLKNKEMKAHPFLYCMYEDDYFPPFLVDKCKQILVNLCGEIERTKPTDLDHLYALTHHATNRLNELQDEFFQNDSELETAARECLAMDFMVIAQAYAFDADVEELIATREW